MSDSVMWDLGQLGKREGRVTPDAIVAMELVHGPIGGTIARFSQDGASWGETISIVHATLVAAEGDGAPSRGEITEAIREVGLGEFIKPAQEALRIVLTGTGPPEERLQ